MSDDYFYSYPNQTICSVLSAIRKCHETRNYSYLLGLVENAQYLADKMEAALNDKADVREWTIKRDQLKREIRTLKAELIELKKLKEPQDD